MSDDQSKSIYVYIKLVEDGFSKLDELDLRYDLEDAIDERGIGTVYGSGSGDGWMDISFYVADEAAVEPAIKAMRALLAEFKVADERIKFEVLDDDGMVCEEMPDFQPGDCLSFRYGKGDYGAMLLLARDDNDDTRILVGILDYRQPELPDLSIFEKRQWLIATGDARAGQPYLIWLYCYEAIEIHVIGKIPLRDDDPKTTTVSWWWEIFVRQLETN